MADVGGIADIFLRLCSGKVVTISFSTFQELNSFKVMIYREKKRFEDKSALLEMPPKFLRWEILDTEKNKVRLTLLDERKPFGARKAARTYEFAED